MGRYVSIRHNGSLTVWPTAWLVLGILAPAALLLSGLWLQPLMPGAAVVVGSAVGTIESLLWIGAASICLFTALVIHAAGTDGQRTLFLAMAGIVTLWLALDDAFLLSGEVASSVGIPALAVSLFHFALAALYLALSWRFLLSGRTLLFALAVVLFWASGNADLLAAGDEPLRFFIEEGLKFLAVAFWAVFHIIAAATAVEELVTGRITTVHVSRSDPLRRLK
jgi:hypothetical protein